MWDVDCGIEQTLAVLDALHETYFDNDTIREIMKKSGAYNWFDNARLLQETVSGLLWSYHDKLDSLVEKPTINLETEVVEVAV